MVIISKITSCQSLYHKEPHSCLMCGHELVDIHKEELSLGASFSTCGGFGCEGGCLELH